MNKSATKIRRVISAEVREPEPGLWSNCLVVGDQVFISGQVARASGGGIVGVDDPYLQSVTALEHVRALMEAAGGTMSDVVKLTIYLTDIHHRPAFIEARRLFFTGDYPTAVLVGNVTLAAEGLLVEIDALGIIGAGRRP